MFSLVVKYRSIRMLLAMVAKFNLELEQIDVKTTLLYDDLDEIILIRQPEGWAKNGKEDYVCKLNRSLYGLKKSLWQKNKRFDMFMAHRGFTMSQFDHCVYFRFWPRNSLIILLIYVDDIIIASNNVKDVSIRSLTWRIWELPPGFLGLTSEDKNSISYAYLKRHT